MEDIIESLLNDAEIRNWISRDGLAACEYDVFELRCRIVWAIADQDPIPVRITDDVKRYFVLKCMLECPPELAGWVQELSDDMKHPGHYVDDIQATSYLLTQLTRYYHGQPLIKLVVPNDDSRTSEEIIRDIQQFMRGCFYYTEPEMMGISYEIWKLAAILLKRLEDE